MSEESNPGLPSDGPCNEGPCLDAQKHVWEYLDGEMSADDCARIREHIEHCPPCDDMFRTDKTVKQVVARACACETAPQDLRGRVLNMLDQLRTDMCGGRAADAHSSAPAQAPVTPPTAGPRTFPSGGPTR